MKYKICNKTLHRSNERSKKDNHKNGAFLVLSTWDMNHEIYIKFIKPSMTKKGQLHN